MSRQQINEEQLKTRICEHKNKQEYRLITEYLIKKLSFGCVPLQLQGKAYNELGLAHLQLEELHEAEKAFMSAIERAPKEINPKFNLANLAMYAQRYDEAYKIYCEIIKYDSNHVGATFHAGLCLAMNDKPNEALPYFERSAKMTPKAMGPNFWAGEVLMNQKQYNKALPYFYKATQITPDHEESQRGLAISLLETGENKKCIDQCDKLIASGKGSEYLAWQVKGDAFIEMGEIETAAICHLQLADMDFDSRDFLILRAKKLKTEYPQHVVRYAQVVIDKIPELKPAFDEICKISQ